MRDPVRLIDRPFTAPVALGLTATTVYLFILVWAMGNTAYDVWGALVIAPVLIGITVPLLVRAARKEADPRMTTILVGALVLKLIGAVVRYFVAFEIYGGVADADAYHDWGTRLAPFFRHGDFVVDVGARIVGTGFMGILTGLVYAVTGPTRLGGFLIFSWFGFWGLYFFYRAFRVAVPHGDHRRYALLVFFLPSMLFWSSSIGKEAWMTLTLGLAAYGLALALKRRPGGLLVLGLGMAGTAMVRPHVTLIAFVGIAVAFLLRRPARPSLLSPVTKAFGLVVLVVAGLIVVSQVESFFGVDRLDHSSVDQVLKQAGEGSAEGSSTFEAVRPGSPLGLGEAAIAVLFRPWPTEASSGPALFASLEGVVMLLIVVFSGRRLMAIPREFRRTPYVAFALVFSLLFIFTFASIGNFGNIARQRVQLFPVLLVLVCIPPVPRRRARPTGRRPVRAHGAREPLAAAGDRD